VKPYDKLMQRISAGERILIDGATGTEVERRGVPQLDNAWNGGGALSHPDIVRGVHEDYIRHGAEIIIANTFATTRHALRDAGVEHQFDDLNRIGVELALEARDRMQKPDVLVAGGISYWSWTGNHPPLDVLRGDVERQAELMARTGADLLMLEMMVDIDRMLVTFEAAETAGLPVWIGMTCEADDDDVRLRNGESLDDALAALKGRNVPLISLMHMDVTKIDVCLEALKRHWSGPIGVYAHSSHRADGKWVYDDAVTPQAYATASARWLQNGVQVIGGCCGVRVPHIEKLAEIL